MQLVYGISGRLQIPLPACAYNAIRTKFPSHGETFTGYDEGGSE